MSDKLTKAQKQQRLDLIPTYVVVGSEFISGDGRVFKITKIAKDGSIDLGYDEDGEVRKYGSYDTYEELMERMTYLDKPIEEYEKELLKDLGNDFAAYKPDEEATSTDVVLMSGKEKALEAQRHLEAVTNKLAVISGIMERKKNELWQVKNNMQKALRNVSRVIGIIELYLGVHADIEQIKEGEPADESTPISFRQLVLHMDEEIALEVDIEGGLDFSKVSLFDKYAIKFIDTLLPEKKGVVVLRPRRNSKDYGEDDPFVNEYRNRDNFETFVLIRNGENIYRIHTKDMNIYPHLFPSHQEMEKLNSDEHYRMDDEKKEEVKLGYKRNALFLQGLIDRTNIFKPHAEGLNIFKPETYEKGLNFIYDASGIADGRMSFTDWQEDLNLQIARGDRVYFAGGIYNHYGDRYDRYEWEVRFPQKTNAGSPKAGVYNVKRMEKVDSSEMIVCHYYPNDVVDYDWVKGEMVPRRREKAVPFRMYKHDDFLINYEKIKIEDIDYYLRDRVNRKYYLQMMPVLKGIKKQIMEERKMENGFVEFMIYQTKATEKEIRDAVEWWKRKVIEKRPLTKEDAKAVRMIKKYLKSGDTGEEVE